jgi:hypothetical protein
LKSVKTTNCWSPRSFRQTQTTHFIQAGCAVVDCKGGQRKSAQLQLAAVSQWQARSRITCGNAARAFADEGTQRGAMDCCLRVLLQAFLAVPNQFVDADSRCSGLAGTPVVTAARLAPQNLVSAMVLMRAAPPRDGMVALLGTTRKAKAMPQLGKCLQDRRRVMYKPLHYKDLEVMRPMCNFRRSA